MIEIRATVESLAQAESLLEAGVDTIYFGEETFSLRMPASFTRKEQAQLVQLAHDYGKKAIAAVNGLMHPDKMDKLPDYLKYLAEISTDGILAGDAGVIYQLNHSQLDLPFIYDGETLVTNSRQINFWAKKGAAGAVLAREVPFEEMQVMAENLTIPTEVLVYGATCIHQSKRPLLENYYQYKGLEESSDKTRGLFLSDPEDSSTHYSIYEDSHGTHIFASNDVNLIKELPLLAENNYCIWKLDGLFTLGDNFVEIVKIFVEAKKCLESHSWSGELAAAFDKTIHALHPKNRGLGQGFFYVKPDEIK